MYLSNLIRDWLINLAVSWVLARLRDQPQDSEKRGTYTKKIFEAITEREREREREAIMGGANEKMKEGSLSVGRDSHRCSGQKELYQRQIDTALIGWKKLKRRGR